jgi:hypothetical protein
MRERFRGILSLNPGSEFKTLKDWEDLGLNCLTLTLTPALSPGEREKRSQRIGKMRLCWFKVILGNPGAAK